MFNSDNNNDICVQNSMGKIEKADNCRTVSN